MRTTLRTLKILKILIALKAVKALVPPERMKISTRLRTTTAASNKFIKSRKNCIGPNTTIFKNISAAKKYVKNKLID